VRLHVQEVGAAYTAAERRDDQTVEAALKDGGAEARRAIRPLAWLLVVSIALFQAYAQRYVVGPDGVAYLDLSDAVVAGRWSGLVNLYWSPLYPMLVGLARLLTRASPAGEVPVMHAVNAAAFLATFAAYEYFLSPVLGLAAQTRHAVVGSRWGKAIAYCLFICVAFTLTPIELTTPDLLAAACVFAALGALLRLGRSPHNAAPAAVLGLSLALGGLAKSFLIPWAIVCFVVLAVALRGTGFKPLVNAALVWLILVGPWTVLVSRAAGRLTFGDTGRLTYAWFVNNRDTPSLGGVPMGARTARTESILPHTGATGEAPGTDPMWFDPERWSGGLRPHFDAHDQIASLLTSGRFYVENLAPFLFLILLIAVAPAASRRDAWGRGWIILVPVVAGMFGYAMVLVTARYFMPFVLTGTLVLLATLPAPRRVHPLAVLIGVAIPIGLLSIDDRSAVSLAVVVSIVGAMVAGARIPMRPSLAWVLGVVVVAEVVHILLPSAFPGVLLLGGAGLAAALWGMSRAAIHRGRPVQFARGAMAACGLAAALWLVYPFAQRLRKDEDALRRASAAGWGNLSGSIATDLAARGIGPGTRIAVIGPHADSYWARTGRLKIVASVPRPVVPMFWRLSRAGQDSLLAVFAAAGAQVAIASVGPDSTLAAPDSTWTPVRYRGWIRPLVAPR
jgi:hypothetical protein